MAGWLATLPIWALIVGALALWLLAGLIVGLALGALFPGEERPSELEGPGRAARGEPAAAKRRIVTPLLVALALVLAAPAERARAESGPGALAGTVENDIGFGDVRGHLVAAVRGAGGG